MDVIPNSLLSTITDLKKTTICDCMKNSTLNTNNYFQFTDKRYTRVVLQTRSKIICQLFGTAAN